MTGPSEVTRALRRARALEQPAFLQVFDEAAIAAATAPTAPTAPTGSSAARAPGDGPLAGLPFAVKANIDVRGVPTTAGDPARTTPAARNAVAVQRLVDAGAVPIGATAMDQYATGLVGTRSPAGACHSVYSPDHVSGGSSSGSAVAVAAGVIPLALGTDTAGSGRVPAAFNGVVGFKPTRGLVSTRGVVPAAPSLDCVTTFTRTVAEAATAFGVLRGHDPADPWSRPMPTTPPDGVAATMRVIAVPAGTLDLEPGHEVAWKQALAHAGTVAHLVPVDVEPFLAAARLLYEAAFVAERTAAFGAALREDRPGLDPTVRRIVLDGDRWSAADAFAGLHELARLRRRCEQVFVGCDALLLPVTPWHPTLADVAADPIGANARNGVFTNMANLLDLCAVALPAGSRPDGLPFGVQLLAPAFADLPLLGLALRWAGEAVAPAWTPPPDRELVAVAGAHLHGQPANARLVELGGRLHARARTAAGYRMHLVPGPFPRPGLVAGEGPAGGLEVEVWSLPHAGLEVLRAEIAPPLGLGDLALDDGTVVTGFVAGGDAAAWPDLTGYGSWRGYLDAGA